jgi:hypothetical protein
MRELVGGVQKYQGWAQVCMCVRGCLGCGTKEEARDSNYWNGNPISVFDGSSKRAMFRRQIGQAGTLLIS